MVGTGCPPYGTHIGGLAQGGLPEPTRTFAMCLRSAGRLRVAQTRPSASVPAEKSRFFACLLCSLMFRRRSFTESALRNASS
jgi:hypothetical protein